jgi:hypothetical protein
MEPRAGRVLWRYDITICTATVKLCEAPLR